MSMFSWLCPSRWPWCHHEKPTSEAQEQLARLEAHDQEVKKLAADLREVGRKNNFSGMVAAALRQRPRGSHDH